jgi:uncharacterized DUF497 family protein
MKIEFDPVKSEKNSVERGLPFNMIDAFEWASALMAEDIRKVYPERRFEAIGFIDGRLHVVLFAFMHDRIRVISFRKANKREIARYEKAKSERA